MKHTTKTSWKEGLHFTSTLDNQDIEFDATALAGNHHNGVSPKKILLSSLAGCTGMDVASLLKKFKVPYSNFNLTVTGELTEVHPKYYRSIHVVYDLQAEDQYREKIEKAVELSRDQYCGVQAMLRQAADISYEINLIP